MTDNAQTTHSAKILLDSVSEAGARITTFEVVFPRCVLAEFNTHRDFSRNSASSRAIPVYKQIRNIATDPYVPGKVGLNQPGMQASAYLESGTLEHDQFLQTWLESKDNAVIAATALLVGRGAVSGLRASQETTGRVNQEELFDILDAYEQRSKSKNLLDSDLNIHKQVANRILEPFMWHTVIVTATTYSNFFALRNHKDTDPALAVVAKLMQDAYESNTDIQFLKAGQWHLPLVQKDELEAAQADPLTWAMISSGRCARASYLTHHGVRDVSQDQRLAGDLQVHGHMSPFEHPAQATEEADERSGNFVGFKQFRKTFLHEDDFSKR